MKRIALTGGALAAVLLVTGTPTTREVQAQATAMVRVAHMAPGAPNVDVTVNNQRAFANLAFKSATQYAALPAGSYNAKVTPAGQTQPVVIDANLTLQAGQAITVVATGELPTIQPLVLQDNNAPPPAGQAKVRFVHASPDAPAVDIAVQGGPVLFRNVAFRGVGDYAAVPAGTYTLEVRPAGQAAAVLTVPNVSLSAGQIVTIFAAGKVADGSLAAVPVAYQAQPTMPRTGAAPAAGNGAALWLLVAAASVLAAGGMTLRLAALRVSHR